MSKLLKLLGCALLLIICSVQPPHPTVKAVESGVALTKYEPVRGDTTSLETIQPVEPIKAVKQQSTGMQTNQDEVRAIVTEIAATKGWSVEDWMQLIANESGFNNLARNPSSDACGLAQALPCSKMGLEDWTDPRGQLQWMATYIEGRYGNPSSALAIWQLRSPNWY